MSSADNIVSVRERALHRGRKRTQQTVLDNPLTRALLSLAVSLGLFVSLANLPMASEPSRVGWRVASPRESISLYPFFPQEDRSAPDPMSSALEAAAHVDPRQSPEETQEPSGIEEPQRIETEMAADTAAADEEGSVRTPLEIFEISGRKPDVAGGMGSLYMHVQYPLAAREQGIEGRVILTFTVDKEGYTHDIQVMQSAHPMLDSAAVRAVEQTTFVPGEHDGQPVAVRMRLPIRFQLVSDNRK